MGTWIFQGNPETFDIDGYLAASSGVVLWMGPKLFAEIEVGDNAYIWRSAGDGSLPAGIVAAGSVIERPRIQTDDPVSKPFWKNTDNQVLCVAVATKMGSGEVLETLYPLLLRRRRPDYIRSDNGPEFSAAPFQEWLCRVGIQPIRIYPGSRWENGCVLAEPSFAWTSASTGRYDVKFSTPSGSRRPSKLRSSSINGSGSTITSARITRSTCGRRYPKRY